MSQGGVALLSGNTDDMWITVAVPLALLIAPLGLHRLERHLPPPATSGSATAPHESRPTGQRDHAALARPAWPTGRHHHAAA